MRLDGVITRLDLAARASIYRARGLTHAPTQWRARRRRQSQPGCDFIGVTGSCGKTTTKELIAAVLGAERAGIWSDAGHNCQYWTARTLLGLRREHRFCVQEVGTAGPGMIARIAQLFRPTVAVVTVVGNDHYRAFRSREAIAQEKGALVRALPASGIAVLNADDALVRAMAADTAARVVTYGVAADADVRAADVVSAWPGRLRFTAHYQGREVAVVTRLVGTHWVTAVLAALATGVALGVPLERAAAALAEAVPVTGRMSPEGHPDGVTFIRDDIKAPYWTMDTALQVLRDATARRKILVLGTISDYPGSKSTKYERLARRALDVADEVIFVGSQAGLAKAQGHPRGEALTRMPTLVAAATYLEETLRPGDLVLLKGSVTADHLGRLALHHARRVACWRERCGRRRLCDFCRLRTLPSGLAPGSAAPS